jgi:DNA-binding MarR family transcriptional regulator
MLTRTLRRLEARGLLTRTVHRTTPPSVEYALTPLGRSLNQPAPDPLPLEQNFSGRETAEALLQALRG